jgi:hypothetical protein
MKPAAQIKPRESHAGRSVQGVNGLTLTKKAVENRLKADQYHKGRNDFCEHAELQLTGCFTRVLGSLSSGLPPYLAAPVT